MNWESVLRGAMWGALIGAVVGVYLASQIMARRKLAVIADLKERGLVATTIAGDWFHIGTKARYRVELEHGGKTVGTAARVDRKLQVTWESELPASSPRS